LFQPFLIHKSAYIIKLYYLGFSLLVQVLENLNDYHVLEEEHDDHVLEEEHDYVLEELEDYDIFFALLLL